MSFGRVFIAAAALLLSCMPSCLDVPEVEDTDGGTWSTATEAHQDPYENCGRCHHQQEEQIKGCETCHGYPPESGTHLSHSSLACSKCHPVPESWLTPTHPDTKLDLKTDACTPCHGDTMRRGL
jgi:hypothetical protein